MATIWNDNNHIAGETFEVSDNSATAAVKEAFSGVSGQLTKIDAEDYVKSGSSKEIRIPADYKKDASSIVFYFSDSIRNWKVVADPSLNGANFRWTTKGKSTNRGLLTQIKEQASLEMMLREINNDTQISRPYELSKIVERKVRGAKGLFREVYYTSAVAHAEATKGLPFSGEYIGELQQDKFTIEIYQIARKLTGKLADNWNPADVWFIRKTDKKRVLAEMKKISSLITAGVLSKEEIAYQFKDVLDSLLSEGALIGVSLKQVENGAAKASLVSHDKIKAKSSTMNFKVKKSYIRKTKKKNTLPAYGELLSESGFSVRWGARANATKANINYEGSMEKSNHQLGAIDAVAVNRLAEKKGIKLLKDSDFGSERSGLLLKNMKKYIDYIKKHDIIVHSTYVGEYTELEMIGIYGWVECKRFVATIAAFEFVNSLSEEELLDMFLLAKKVGSTNPNYYLLN